MELATCLALLAAACLVQADGPCAANPMCRCRFHDGSRELSEVACSGVPLSLVPELPAGGALVQLDVVGAGLEVLDGDSLRGARAEFLRFASNELQHLDQDVFSSMATLMSLDLSFNELDEVPFVPLQYVRTLDWLNLQNNYITRVDSATTHGWAQAESSLTTLFLGDNELTGLPPYRGGLSPAALRACRKLAWLNLDGNKLSSLEPDTLPASLRTLGASRNLLTSFPAAALEELPDLAWLDLRGNYIDSVPAGAFRTSKHLDRLDLGENVIETLPPTMFNRSLTVRDLNLDYNYVKSLPPQAFGGTNVGRLYLSYNRLGSVDHMAFVGLGHTLEFLDMDHNDLQQVPKALRLLKRLNYLYISYNNISVVARDAFEGFAASLRALSLAGNFLRRIPREALADCRSLTYFNIAYNKIDVVSAEDLEWAESLDTLFLQSNHLTTLAATTFKKTPLLRELSLSFNKLTKFDPGTFTDISKNLQSLELSFSLESERFLDDILKPLKYLQWLSLDNNNFGKLNSNVLYSFGKLQYLDLEYSRLDSIPPELFNGDIHEHLRDLRLSHNNIETIESDSFSSMNSLQTVVLVDNRLKSIATHAFDSLQNVITIDMSENMIGSIAPRSFYNLPKVLHLNLQGNSLNELSLSVFYNVSSVSAPVSLNVSRNNISQLYPGDTGSAVHMHSLDFSHNKVAEVPVNFLQRFADSMRRLHMGHNLVRALNQAAFGTLGVLEVLTLEGNRVSEVSKDAFRGLESLQVLVASANAIEQLQAQQFSCLRRLRVVDLSRNRIRSLPRDVFAGTRLERLDLSGNDVVAMPGGALGPVAATLRRLDLSGNRLEHLDASMFPAASRLSRLDLARNRLTALPDDVFAGLGRLVRLDLGGNSLRGDLPRVLRPLRRLRRLGLAAAGLREAPRLPLPALVALDLSGNLLQDLPGDRVRELARLQELSLAGNRLPSVPAGAWPHLPVLRVLALSANPIKASTLL
ncbi:chaoptin-like [Bacillus rossius redtenbacheri]|uniref:chaoptin-like n=1 Tax=Bacillus rossius redtenbacheri TaxID=93214 RepID=UPI002FDD3E12